MWVLMIDGLLSSKSTYSVNRSLTNFDDQALSNKFLNFSSIIENNMKTKENTLKF